MAPALDPPADIWCVDFEFRAPPGERQHPLCMVAREVHSHQLIRCWLDGQAPRTCPLPLTRESLFVAYYASAELQCFLALGWPLPPQVLDLCAEFRWLTSGVPLSGHTLLHCLEFFGLDAMAAVEKATMHELAQQHRPLTATEQAALVDYCQADADALARLLPVMLPRLDLPHALLRGHYMKAVAHIERAGIPLDTPLLMRLTAEWDSLRYRIAATVNRDFPVFLPKGQTLLDPTTASGAAIVRTAAAWDLDPYLLAGCVDQVWHDERELFRETRQARRAVRVASGVTAAGIARWERAGYDYATWPGLDDRAEELADQHPAAFLDPHPAPSATDDPDLAARLWDLVRQPDPPLPAKHAPHILRRAASLLRQDTLETWDGSPLVFSTRRFAQYLSANRIAWPRLASGALDLKDQTFKDMARIHPHLIAPIREARTLLAQLRQIAVPVGSDGRNRTLLGAFGSKTSRNQPRASEYIFGPSCWLRSLIRPEPGRALAYCDWSQQELGIAAALSQDPAMMAAYQSGDFYLEFAKMAGKAPAWATKDTHPEIREQFKSIALGVLYGLSAYGAAQRLDLAICDSRELLRCHREVFRTFWAWSDAVEMRAMYHGTLSTVFGWHVRTTTTTTGRSARNYPMQSNAAEMMRLACILTTQHGISVCGVVHDALLVEASLDTIDAVVEDTQRWMREASLLVLPGFPLRSEPKVVRYPDHYSDPRGAYVWQVVERLLDADTRESEVLKGDGDEVPF